MTIPILCMKNPGFQRQIKCMSRRHHSHILSRCFSNRTSFFLFFIFSEFNLFIIFFRFFLFLVFIYFQPPFISVFISSFSLFFFHFLFLSSIASYTFFLILISSSFFIVFRLRTLCSILFVSITFFFISLLLLSTSFVF